jgi:hypothetical protein
MARIGVLALDYDYFTSTMEGVKRDLLFFDKLIYNDQMLRERPEMFIHTGLGDLYKTKLKELDVLEGLGYLQKRPLSRKHDHLIEPSRRENVIDELNKFFEAGFTNYRDNWATYKNGFEQGRETIKLTSAFFSFGHALTNNIIDPENEYIPLFKSSFLTNSDEQHKKANVIKVVLSKVSTVSNDLTVQQLLEIKSDQNLKRDFYALRMFISELSKQNLPQVEIEDKLEYLLLTYEKSLSLHKAKMQSTILEIFLTTALDFITGAVTGLVIPGTKAVFSLTQTSLKYIEDEMNLTGKEVAYITKINEKLSK